MSAADSTTISLPEAQKTFDWKRLTFMLLGMGLRSLSMHPARIPAVKQRILRVDTRKLAVRTAAVLAADEPELEMQRLQAN